MQVDDSEQLHLIPLIADVKVKPPKAGYDASSTMRYLPLDAGKLAAGGAGASRGSSRATGGAGPPAKTGTAPWRRGS